jgi:adenylate cyclase
MMETRLHHTPADREQIIADLRRQLTASNAERDEALAQQQAIAEVLEIINSSRGDLAPVWDAMLEKAARLCSADFGSISGKEDSGLRVTATNSTAPEYEAFIRGNVLPLNRGSLLGRAAVERKVVQIPDLVADPEFTLTELITLGMARTALGVPLMRGDEVIGGIMLARQRVEPFGERQIELVRAFADQAVIAIENARLITETREALEQQTATAQVLQVINSSPGDLAPVFDVILEKAHTLCDASFGALVICEGELFRSVALRGPPAALAEVGRRAFRLPPDSSVGQMLRGEPFIQVPDMAAELAPRAPEGSLQRALVELAGVRTQLLVALRKDDALLGFISAYRQEVRPFSEKEIALLENFAAQAVIAMENARLLGELRVRTEEVAELNRGLEARVAEQVDELGRVGRLKRFLAPQLAELIVSQGDEKILESHRREIVVVFCDLRGYTAFTETAEPEEVLDFLREYHGALGPLVAQFEGTLDQFSGDGIMVFFNDPVPIPNPAERAVKMAVAMREAAGLLIVSWRERGRDLGFGAGIAQGYATLGQIGFSERSGYTAIGTVCNVAARLCAEAKDGQILLSQRVNVALKGSVATEQVGALALKGLTQPVIAYNVPLAATQPALRVIEGGPQSV